jgi:hypothetical protein
MPSQPPSARSTVPGQRFSGVIPRTDWGLLTRLPGEVVIVATTAQADSPRRTVAAGLAGLDAIAAGRSSDSDLVRGVAAAIYAESAGTDERPAGMQFEDRSARAAAVLGECRHAAAALAAWADPADSAAYRQWVQHVAARVCGAARPGLLGVSGPLAEAERRFLDDLGAALGLR